ALRELVVIRKIIGSLRNKKGARIVETIMTMITTWRQRGLDTFSELRDSI
ncbi:MAG TPA: IS66 family transposase, partial [Candidatus Nanoarchaeia archaeon]|nr:IS66 family transposase [Candidatus Nanoarchaeia archaeon]